MEKIDKNKRPRWHECVLGMSVAWDLNRSWIRVIYGLWKQVKKRKDKCKA